MNLTGCEPGYASDQMFQNNRLQDCDVPLVAYYVYTMSIVFLNLSTAIKVSMNWTRKFCKTTSRDIRRHGTLLPLVPLSYFTYAFTNVSVAVLGGQNIINFTNGLSLALYSIAFLPFACVYTYGLIKLVRLGERIIPKSHREFAKDANLALFDSFGKFLMGFAVISYMISSCALIILGPIFPKMEQIFFQVGFGFKAGYISFILAGYIYQFERCIRVIKDVDKSVMFSHQPQVNKLEFVIRKMRTTQALHFSVGFPSILFLVLLAGGALPASVWAVLLPPAIEAIGNFFYAFSIKRKSRPKHTENEIVVPPTPIISKGVPRIAPAVDPL